MTEPEVVVKMRAAIIDLFRPEEWVTPEMVDTILAHVDTVPYRGDNHAYIADAVEVMKTTLDTLVRPQIARMEAGIAAAEASIAEMTARYEFCKMKTDDWIH